MEFVLQEFINLTQKLTVYLFLQNDDEDMLYMYNAYMHKMMMCFLSHPRARDKVR